MKDKKSVVVGITSGIAAYKMLDLITLLKKDTNVIVVMTKSARQMVLEKEFEVASGNKVYTDLFEKDFDYKKVLESREVDHIRIADMADIVVIAPATANILGKIRSGIADDFLTTMLLATQAPIVVFPSMNVHMWQNGAVLENVSILRKRGVIVIEPDEGALACGYEGKGRLPEVEEIHKEITKLLKKTQSLQGKKIIVTAGGTKEPIDGVRYITNNASGKMGIAIAEVCFLQGAEVLLVRSKTAVSSRYDIKQVVFEISEELAEILKKEVPRNDVIFHSAAVSDFHVQNPHKGKIASRQGATLTLVPTEKIISKIKTWNSKMQIVGFKAVWGGTESELFKKGKEKLEDCHADAIVVNDVSRKDRGFSADTNEVFIIKKNGEKKKISLRSKQEVAEEMVKFLFFERETK